jgi:ribosomal protein S27AE
MAERYIHLTGRDLKNAMLETYGVESAKPKAVELKNKKCQRCDILNESMNQYCKRCGLILDETLALKRMNEQTEVKKLEEEMKVMIESHIEEALKTKDKQIQKLH